MRNRENRQLESRRGTSNILSQKMAASLVITLEFSAFYTEPRVDFVYVFDGSETNAKIPGKSLLDFHNHLPVTIVNACP